MLVEKLLIDPEAEVRSETLHELNVVGEKCNP